MNIESTIFSYKSVTTSDIDSLMNKYMVWAIIYGFVSGAVVPSVLGMFFDIGLGYKILGAMFVSLSITVFLSYNRIDRKLARKIKKFHYEGNLRSIFSFDDRDTKDAFRRNKNKIIRDVYLHSAITGDVLLEVLDTIKFKSSKSDPAISSEMQEEINVLINENTPRGKIIKQVIELAA
jgi:hypothetical protein